MLRLFFLLANFIYCHFIKFRNLQDFVYYYALISQKLSGTLRIKTDIFFGFNKSYFFGASTSGYNAINFNPFHSLHIVNY